MIEAIGQALQNTPWWVYLIALYLLKAGIQSSRTRVVKVKKLFILPLLLLILSLHTLTNTLQINIFNISIWSGATLVGIVAGWWQGTRMVMQVDRARGLIQLSGTWSTLVLLVLVFATKYYFGYNLATDSAKLLDKPFEFSLLACTGLFTGLFLGRMIYYLYRFFIQPSLTDTRS